MQQPNLAMIHKRIAKTMMGLAQHIANPQVVHNAGKSLLLEECKGIVADLQTFTDTYRIEVSPRKPKMAVQCKTCHQWH